MAKTVFDEVFDGQGNLLSITPRIAPEPVISDADYQQARQTLKTMMRTFFPGGVPTGTPTAAQQRNWSIAMTTALRYLYNEMDNE